MTRSAILRPAIAAAALLVAGLGAAAAQEADADAAVIADVEARLSAQTEAFDLQLSAATTDSIGKGAGDISVTLDRDYAPRSVFASAFDEETGAVVRRVRYTKNDR